MFTLKFTEFAGHHVVECHSYRYRKDNSGTANTASLGPTPCDQIDIYDADGAVKSLPILGTVYAMNSAGKTIDTFHAAPSDPNTHAGMQIGTGGQLPSR